MSRKHFTASFKKSVVILPNAGLHTVKKYQVIKLFKKYDVHLLRYAVIKAMKQDYY